MWTTKKETCTAPAVGARVRECNTRTYIRYYTCRSDCVQGVSVVSIYRFIVYIMFSVALFVPCATRPTVVFGLHGTQCYTDQHVMWYSNIIIIYEPGTAACRII